MEIGLSFGVDYVECVTWTMGRVECVKFIIIHNVHESAGINYFSSRYFVVVQLLKFHITKITVITVITGLTLGVIQIFTYFMLVLFSQVSM